MQCIQQRNAQGFTLLEVMIAVAILAIALVSLLGSQSQSISVATDARFDTVAALLAQEKLAEIRLQDFEQVESGSGSFEEEFAEFTWGTEILQVLEDDIALPGTDGMLKQVVLTIALAEDDKRYFRVQTTIFKKLIPMINSNNNGFTLLEVMLAVSILAVVSSMVGFALNSTVNLLSASGNQKDIYRQARVTLERMREDLTATVADGEVGFVGTKAEINDQQADSVVFSSMAHLVFDGGRSEKGSTTIAYTVVEDETDPGSLKLLRSDRLSVFTQESSDQEAYTLCASLRSLQLTYVDSDGQKNDTWESLPDKDEEQTGVLLPAAVFITLEFWQDSEHKAVFPFRSGVWLPTGSISEEGVVSSRHLLRNQKGVALLLALLTVSFLVTMTMQLLVDVDGQIEDAALIQKTVVLENAVYTGLSIVQAALYSDQLTNTYDSLLDSWATIDGEQLASLTDEIPLTCIVDDLSGKLQIHALLEKPVEASQGALGGNGSDNKKRPSAQELREQVQKVEQLWKRFLLSGNFAIDDEQQAADLLDAIRDWIDEDDDARANGAENAYYQSLSPGYNCRNGTMLATEELLFVKGMTPELFYGDEEHEGIAEYITVAGDDGKINLNTAPEAVLAALNPELNEEMISDLKAYREEPDNNENLAATSWYRDVSGLPGDITLDESLLTTTAKAFAITIIAENGDARRSGKGVLLRAENKEQTLLHWRIQ